jgi:alpha-galactosidase
MLSIPRCPGAAPEPRWTWTKANASKTIERTFAELACPAGVTMDPSQILGIRVFLKDGTFQIVNVRVE